MEFLIIIGIIVAIVIFRNLKIQGKLGEEIDTGLNERIRLNEIKMKMAQQNANSDNVNNQENNKMEREQPDTLGLMESILSELGCQPKKDEENALHVAYQGENFVIKTGGPYAQIWDPGWASINVNDPNFENMKVAANIANFDFGPTILYTSPNEEGLVWLHTKQDILVCSEIPDRNEYMRSVLNSFFEKKENMRGRLHSLINQQQQPPKQHRPVGFATDTTEG